MKAKLTIEDIEFLEEEVNILPWEVGLGGDWRGQDMLYALEELKERREKCQSNKSGNI